jgi:hypothetical protein
MSKIGTHELQLAENANVLGMGQTDALSAEQSAQGWPYYEYARSMHPDELWTEPNNGGRDQDPDYIRAYGQAREMLVDMFQSGELYSTPEGFTACLQRLHFLIASSGIYNRLSGRTLDPSYYGRLDDRYGRFGNVRYEQSLAVVPIAARFGDEYGAGMRLLGGRPNAQSVHIIHLPGISAFNLPYDVVRYDAQGRVKEIVRKRADRPDSGYEYKYPDVKDIEEYLYQMADIGRALEGAIKSGQGSEEELLTLIARQYQYGPCGRPFVQINNSLFMQLLNMQVKLLGLPGMTHGIMDIAAQRMQPDTFARYFIARARGLEP